MRLSVVLMVRNEADIIRYSIGHALRLFDDILFVDHNSTDGTFEILDSVASEGRIELFRVRQQGYFQAEAVNLATRRLFARGADWVIPLDADEFIHLPDRHALEAVLRGDHPVCFTWRNLAPSEFGAFHSFTIAQTYLTRRRGTHFVKVAIPRKWAEAHQGYVVTAGNHAVLPNAWSLPVAARKVGELLHIPIRSAERLQLKVGRGREAISARGGDRREGQQWFDIAAEGGMSTDDLTAICLNYGDPSRGRAHEGFDLEHIEIADNQPYPQSADTAATATEVAQREQSLKWESGPRTKPTKANLVDGVIVVSADAGVRSKVGYLAARGTWLFLRLLQKSALAAQNSIQRRGKPGL